MQSHGGSWATPGAAVRQSVGPAHRMWMEGREVWGDSLKGRDEAVITRPRDLEVVVEHQSNEKPKEETEAGRDVVHPYHPHH